jgi:hypothetical protein
MRKKIPEDLTMLKNQRISLSAPIAARKRCLIASVLLVINIKAALLLCSEKELG